MAASSIRFGPGCTKEVGMDFKNMGAKRVAVITDSNVLKLAAMKQSSEGLNKEGIEFRVYDKCRTEPKDSRYDDASSDMSALYGRADNCFTVSRKLYSGRRSICLTHSSQ